MDNYEEYLGIDFGTNSCKIAYINKGKCEIIYSANGNKSSQNYVCFLKDQVLIGDPAKGQMSVRMPKSTVYGIKKLLGKNFNDPKTQELIKTLNYEVIERKNNLLAISVLIDEEYRNYCPEEITSMIIQNLIDLAEFSADGIKGKKITKIVMTCPSWYDENERQAILNSCLLLRLNVILLDETMASAIYFQALRPPKKSTNYLVFDLGAESLKLSVINMDPIAGIKLKVSGGQSNLGGDYFCDTMVKYFMDKIEKDCSGEKSFNLRSLTRLKWNCEYAMQRLDKIESDTVIVDDLLENLDFKAEIGRTTFNKLNEELFKNCLHCVQQTLENGKIDKSSVDKVILVGGASRIPKIRELIDDYFGRDICDASLDPLAAIAMGAAIHGNKS